MSLDLEQWEPANSFELAPERFDPQGRHFLREPRPEDRTIHAWRDPYVFRHGGRWCMLVSALSAGQPSRRNACVALLVAEGDCREAGNWRLEEPSLVTGYEELDVPQLYLEEDQSFRSLRSLCWQRTSPQTAEKPGALGVPGRLSQRRVGRA